MCVPERTLFNSFQFRHEPRPLDHIRHSCTRRAHRVDVLGVVNGVGVLLSSAATIISRSLIDTFVEVVSGSLAFPSLYRSQYRPRLG